MSPARHPSTAAVAAHAPVPPPQHPPPQLATIPTPETMGDAIAALHRSSFQLQNAADELLRLAINEQQNPEFRAVTINPGNNGVYQVVDESPFAAKSIGILNPGSAPVFVGIGGSSARPTSGAPSCPGGATLVLPVEVRDIELGCDPAVLGANATTIYIFRFTQLQPLSLGLG